MATLIKRYANRKLYNTETSRYITLKGVGELLDRGEEVRVVDNETGEDITQIALSQILVDSKRSREDPSETLLSQILSRGGDAVYSAIRRSVDDASDGIGEFQERFRQFVQRAEGATTRPRPFGWERRGRDAAAHAGAPSGAEDEPAASSGAASGSSKAAPRDERTTDDPADGTTTHDLGRLVREAVGRALGPREWPTRTEIDRLNRNLERVAAALERLDARLDESPPRG
ncbi:MAG: polyhydroxyalkanoate synthesis regulator DNA-binding domain-containing protein [Myxococcota bacterium]